MGFSITTSTAQASDASPVVTSKEAPLATQALDADSGTRLSSSASNPNDGNSEADVEPTPVNKLPFHSEVKSQEGLSQELETPISKEPKADTQTLPGSIDPLAATLSEQEEMQMLEEPFRMQEYRPNYIISGKPDTKVQFSFLFRMLKSYSLYLGFTQTMFWELGKQDSNPFSDINFNPELFYKFKFKEAWLKQVDLGYAHMSNGLPGVESRAMDEVFVLLSSGGKTKIGIANVELRLRYILPGSISDNKDLRDYYGPAVLRFNLTRLGRRLFYSEQLYIDYYNGGKWSEDFSKNSVRVSFRFKLFESASAPKFFIQYFNGYGENLRNYNLKDESFRVGLSIGGGYPL